MIRKIPYYKAILFIFDYLILFFSLLVSYEILFFDYLNARFNETMILFYLFVLTIPSIFLFNFYSNNLYKVNVFLTRASHLVNILKSFFYSLVILIVLLFLLNFPFETGTRQFVFVFSVIGLSLIVIYRLFLIKPIFEHLKSIKNLRRKIVIIGAGKSGKLLASKLLVEDQLGVEIVGFADDAIDKSSVSSEDLKILGKIDEVANLNGNFQIDEAIISIDKISYERLIEIINLYNSKGIFVRVNSELFKTIPENLVVEKYSGISVISTTPHINSKYSLFFKSVFDRVAALIILILISPLLLVIGTIIKLTSKGPMIYKQKRIGKDGKVFNFLKFRSMYVLENGHEEDEERKMQMIKFIKNAKVHSNESKKVVNEKRITPIGKILRKYSLDELPQLINVLKGDMSLVGPRPCLPYEYENYEDWQKERHKVLPGCTGVWQVYGRGKVNFIDSVIMDLYYIHNMSPWLDLQLLFKTIPVLILGRGGK